VKKRVKKMATGRAAFQTKEERRKAKELEEARKAGTAPAELDEDGNAINPHIPQYIAQAPWYIDQGGPSLKHQKIREGVGKEKSSFREWYKRGAKAGPAAKAYRKGACENCGAMSHKKKDCVERPRKVGAKFNSKNIEADEVVTEVGGLGYEAKRDRWNGYDVANHKQLMETYEKVTEERARKKEEETLRKLAEGVTKENADSDSDSDGTDDEFKDSHEVQAGQKFDAKTRMTIRNLRLREDTAKYLVNLDPKSAYYDPKTRSMRANPNPRAAVDEDTTSLFVGDNARRVTGDSVNYHELERFAWDAYEKGNDLHVQGVPSQAEFYYKQFQQRKSEVTRKQQLTLAEKYGSDKLQASLPEELIDGQTEEYHEYAPDGRLIKGSERAVAKSKYEEDVLQGNHTTIWGSFWEKGKWGYKCCHNFVRNSYCTGLAGRDAASAPLPPTTSPSKSGADVEEPSEKAKMDSDGDEEEEEDVSSSSRKRGRGTSEENKRDHKKRKHDTVREKNGSSPPPSSSILDERKRKYNSMRSVKEPTEEEMETYRKSRPNWEDPMANFKDTDNVT